MARERIKRISLRPRFPLSVSALKNVALRPSGQVAAGGGGDQFAVLDPLGADQFVGQALDGAGLAFEHHHLQAVVGIEMHMQTGDDRIVMAVLVLGEFVGEISGVVVINQGYGADQFNVLPAPLVFDQGAANQVADCFRAVDIPLLADQGIELSE